MTCLVPLSTLTSAPFNYLFGDLVLVQATSTNNFGSALYSVVNTIGAEIITVPI